MSNEDSGDKEYRAYLVRMWQVSSGGQKVWRALAEDAHSGERHAFADLSHLFAFFQKATLPDKSELQDKEHSDD